MENKKMRAVIKRIKDTFRPLYYLIKNRTLLFMVLSSKKWKDFKKDKYPKLILLNTPAHGNLGDHAITIAEKIFLRDTLPNIKCYDFNQLEYSLLGDKIDTHVNLKDIILVTGGGYIGSVWPNETEKVIHILRRYRNNKIFLFPHSIFFDEASSEIFNRLLEAFNNCKNLIVCVRDNQSFDCIKHRFKLSDQVLYLFPDITTYLSAKKLNISRKTSKKSLRMVLFCFREDKEKQVADSLIEKVRQSFSGNGFVIKDTDTVTGDQTLSIKNRLDDVKGKIQEFYNADLVITDRLHGMLFASIVGTPCLFLDNTTHKVNGTYEWLKPLEYIKPLVVDINFYEFLNRQRQPYDNSFLSSYYEEMAKLIKK